MKPHTAAWWTAVLVVAIGLVGCRAAPGGVPEEVGVPLPAPAEALELEPEPADHDPGEPVPAAVLDVAREPVQLWPAPDAEEMAVYAGETFELAPGARVATGPDGVAVLRWAGLLTVEMLAGADVIVAAHTEQAGGVTLLHHAGYARFGMPARRSDAAVAVQAASARIEPLAGQALDAILGHDDLDGGGLWVLAVGAPLQVRSAASGAGAGAERSGVELAAGEALRYGTRGRISEPVRLDVVAVEVWFGDTAAGTNLLPLGAVAYRCQVRGTGTQVRSAASERLGSALLSLAQGDWVTVLGRSASGDWLAVGELSATVKGGWLAAAGLRCPVTADVLPVAPDLVAEAPPAATAATAVSVAAATPTQTVVGATAVPQQAARANERAPARAGGGAAATQAPAPTAEGGSAAEPTEADPCETECTSLEEPTETPRPPRRPTNTSAPAEPPAPTTAPQPTAAPPEPTAAPPEPTEEPPQPTTEP